MTKAREPPAGAADSAPLPLRIDVSDEGVVWDLQRAQSYGGYLQLDQLLTRAHPAGRGVAPARNLTAQRVAEAQLFESLRVQLFG